MAINPDITDKINVAEAAGFNVPVERPKNRENRWDLIKKKREMFLVQMLLEKKDKEQKKNEANTSAAVRQLGPKSFAAKQAAGPKAGAAKQLGPKAGAAKGALPPMRKFEGPSAFAVLKRLQDALTK